MIPAAGVNATNAEKRERFTTLVPLLPPQRQALRQVAQRLLRLSELGVRRPEIDQAERLTAAPAADTKCLRALAKERDGAVVVAKVGAGDAEVVQRRRDPLKRPGAPADAERLLVIGEG